MDIFDCLDLKRQQLLDVLVNNGVDLDDPNAFIIDECEGITGDWSTVSAIIDYLENGEIESFGIDQQGFAAKRLTVKRVNDAFIYGLYDENGQALHDTVQDNHNTDIVDIDDSTDYEEDENGNPIPQPTKHDCTVTLNEGEHYHVYELGTFKLDEGERLLMMLSETMSIAHSELTGHSFLELEWAWNNHNLNCADLLAVAENLGLIVDYTFKLK